jgi:2-dehydro-3-deoxyphosphogluconate aldolase / (4S)-4-hydroxy-2-oxoglutarate aldolase
MKSVREILGTNKIVPVVKIEDAGSVIPLAAALQRSGITVIEITFRTDTAAEAIKCCRDENNGVVVGAGTVRTKDQVDRAIDSGAEFLVSPGFNPVVCEYALSKGVPHIPGTITPSEIEQATNFGLDVLKFFPAEDSGGVEFLKSLAAVYPDIGIMPTGGINAKNIGQYLALPNVVACGGSWMVKPEWIKDGDFDSVEKESKDAIAAIR